MSTLDSMFTHKLREARRIAQPPEHSPAITDIPYRAVSIFPSLVVARLGISPNVVTVAWGLIGLLGAAALGWPLYGVRVAGSLLLQVSYLLDFVDGEVARLLKRTSKRGFFIDLAAHGLIKSAVFLVAGYGAYRAVHEVRYLLLSFSACVGMSNGYMLPFLAQAAQVRTQPAYSQVDPAPKSAIRRVLGLSGYLFESPGIYGVILLGAVFNHLDWVVVFYGIFGPIWFLRGAVAYRHE